MGDLAAHRVGLMTESFSEIDPMARGVLRYHYPDVPIVNDVKDVHVKPSISTRRVVIAGSPCQDLSIAGKRAGLAGARSGLWWEVARVLEESQAEWFVWENVPGALSSNDGRDFGAILGSLDDLGMGVAWRVLDSQFFGVPQRRRRVFLVARRGGDWGSCGEVLAVGGRGGGDFEASGAQGEGSAGRVEGRVGSSEIFGQTGFASYRRGVVKTLSATDHKRPEDNVVVSTVGNGAGHHQNVVCVTGSVTHTLTAGGADAGEDGTGRGTPIITTNESSGVLGGGTVDGLQVRRLLPVECERLMGLPDEWTKFRVDEKSGNVVEQSDAARYRQCGNGLVVPVMQWVLGRVVAEHQKV
jgi:DNA (cytosine-5)-methyltransferase 1